MQHKYGSGRVLAIRSEMDQQYIGYAKITIVVCLCYYWTVHLHTRGCRECGLLRMSIWGWMVVDISTYPVGKSYELIDTSQPYDTFFRD